MAVRGLFGRWLIAGRLPPLALMLLCLPLLVVLRWRYAKHNKGKGRNDCCRCADCATARWLLFNFWAATANAKKLGRWRRAHARVKMIVLRFAFAPIDSHVALSGYYEPKEKLFKNLIVGNGVCDGRN